jgi:hypothetical protein
MLVNIGNASNITKKRTKTERRRIVTQLVYAHVLYDLIYLSSNFYCVRNLVITLYYVLH